MASRLLAGYAQVDISPAVGDPQWTATIETVHDPVLARALYLAEEGGQEFILVMADHGGFDRVADRRMRAAISAATGVPASHVRVNGSHNHTCPEASWAVAELLAGIGQAHVSLDWLVQCEQRLATAAAEARRSARPVTVHAGNTEVYDVAANRAFYAADGGRVIRLGSSAAGPAQAVRFGGPTGLIDPVVSVLDLRQTDGRSLAILANFACHVTGLTQRSRLVSADFPGHAARLVEAATGAPLFFLQGAAGNVGTGKYADGSMAVSQELGRRLAEPILRLLPGLEPVRSTPLRLSHWREAVALHPRVPSASELRELLQPSDRHQWLVASKLNAVADPLTRELDLFVLHAGDWLLCGLPAESMVEAAIALRAASPVPHTLVGAYYDCSLWYIPTQDRLRNGGYEATGDWDYTAPGTSEQITAAMIARLR